MSLKKSEVYGFYLTAFTVMVSQNLIAREDYGDDLKEGDEVLFSLIADALGAAHGAAYLSNEVKNVTTGLVSIDTLISEIERLSGKKFEEKT